MSELRAPWIEAAGAEPHGPTPFTAPPLPGSLFGFPSQPAAVGSPTGATVTDEASAPFVIPPVPSLPAISTELLPATEATTKTLPDEQVGTETDPFHASKVGGYEQTYNPFPVQVPAPLEKLVDVPQGNPISTGRALPQPPVYTEPGWNIKPLLPEPSISAEIPVPTGYEPKTMPDETVGTDLSPYFFAAQPFPESIYNAYPSEKPPTLADIMEKKV